MKAIKTLRGATAMARFIAELPDASVGMVWRKVFEGVPTNVQIAKTERELMKGAGQ